MKQAHGIIAQAAIAFLLLFSLAGPGAAENTDEAAEISAAMKLYAEALPMEVISPKRAELLDQSAMILQEVIENNPKSMDAHRKLMGVYLLKQDYSNAIRTMQDAITLSPEDPKLFITLAFLYEHSGALEYSEAMLDQALTLDPNQQLAKDYKIVIQQKIAARKMDDLHQGKVEAGHGTAAGSAHPPMDKTAHPPMEKKE